MFNPFNRTNPFTIVERVSDVHQQMAHSTTNAFTRADISTYAKPGDMIEFHRGNYSHWAIYIGKDKVIHSWGEGDGIMNSRQLLTGEAKAGVLESNFCDILGNDTARVNNSLDWKFTPFDQATIVSRARALLGREGYHFLNDNCEHFATECRYGQKISIQAENARTVATVINHVSTTRSPADLIAAFMLRR